MSREKSVLERVEGAGEGEELEVATHKECIEYQRLVVRFK